MRIHTNTLTRADMLAAAELAGVGTYRLAEHGSRSRDYAFDVILEGSGRTGTRYGQNSDMVAATWDEWGIFLGEVFRRDPGAIVPSVYLSGDHFRWATGARYDTLTPAEQHIRHRWGYERPAVTGAYRVRECDCGAIVRELWRATWEQIGGAA